MSALIDLQREMAGAIRGDATPGSVPVVRPNHLPEGDPLSVYRNNHQIGLRGALAATFQTIPLLIGNDAFNVLAGRFLSVTPPMRPCLTEYGSEFPNYLDGEPLLAELPYLADVARLDWAFNVAKTSVDIPALDNREIVAMMPNQIADLRADLHPSATVVQSKYPLLDIYRLSRQGDEGDAVSLDRGGCDLLVARKGKLTVIEISVDTVRAIERVSAGEPLSDVFECRSSTDLSERLGKCGLLGALAVRSVGSTSTFSEYQQEI